MDRRIHQRRMGRWSGRMAFRCTRVSEQRLGVLYSSGVLAEILLELFFNKSFLLTGRRLLRTKSEDTPFNRELG